MAKKKSKSKKRGKKKSNKQIKDNYSLKEMDMTFEDTRDLQQLYLLGEQFGFSDPNFEAIFQQFEDIHK